MLRFFDLNIKKEGGNAGFITLTWINGSQYVVKKGGSV